MRTYQCNALRGSAALGAIACATLLSFATLPGCATQGTVIVGRPQVFTRERLVDERVREYEWARGQLDQNITPTLAGYRDVRAFEGFAQSVSGAFNPLSATALAAPTAGPGTGVAAVKPPDTLAKGSDAQKTAAESDAIEVFDYRQAVRNRINAAMRQTQLDDTHDLHGSTLYSLQIDLTVLPGRRTSEYAVVELTILPPDDETRDVSCEGGYTEDASGPKQVEVYQKWIASLAIQIRDEQLDLQQRLLTGSATDQDQLAVASCSNCGSTVNLPQIRQFNALPLQQRLANPESDELMRAAAMYVRNRYLAGLTFDGAPIANIEAPRPLKVAAVPFYVSGVTAGDDHQRIIFWRRRWLLDCWSGAPTRAYVAYVEPKEYAQNVSELAARETFLQMVASLQATLPQYGTDLKSYSDYARKSQSLLQAITREPLVIGYANGTDRFGWLLGPSFKIDGYEAEFQQSPIRQSVSAAIAVPAWWTSFRLAAHVGWRTASGEVDWHRVPWWRLPGFWWFHPAETPEAAQGNSLVDSDDADVFVTLWPRSAVWGGPIKITLPGDEAELTKTLIAENGEARHLPALEPNIDRVPATIAGIADAPQFAEQERIRPYYLQATTCAPGTFPVADNKTTPVPEQTIYVRGRDLWRNPQVYVGSQRADIVEVHPDMGGLLAHFKQVVLPLESQLPGSSPVSGTSGAVAVDLRVVTSVGEAVLPKAVIIYPGHECHQL